MTNDSGCAKKGAMHLVSGAVKAISAKGVQKLANKKIALNEAKQLLKQEAIKKINVTENITKTEGLNDGLGTYSNQAGHHPLAKSAYEGNSQYDFKEAITVSQAKLSEFGVKHVTITEQQKSLYSVFAKSGEELTLDAMKQIEINAMTNSGVPINYAANAVDKAVDALVKSGVTNPSRIPWTN